MVVFRALRGHPPEPTRETNPPATPGIYFPMALWIILVLGWLAVLLLALFLVRIAGYAEKKMRGLANRPRGRGNSAPNEILAKPIPKESPATGHEEDEKIA